MGFETNFFSASSRNAQERNERHLPMITEAAFGVFKDQDDMMSAMTEFTEE